MSPQRSLLRGLPSWVPHHHSPLTRAASRISSKGSSSWMSPQRSLLRGLPSWVPHHQSPLTRAAPWTFSKGSSLTGVPSRVFSEGSFFTYLPSQFSPHRSQLASTACANGRGCFPHVCLRVLLLLVTTQRDPLLEMVSRTDAEGEGRVQPCSRSRSLLMLSHKHNSLTSSTAAKASL